ncbi:MAG TPA: PDZ domain-containing protein [Longimicrobiaceae bacterium]
MFQRKFLALAVAAAALCAGRAHAQNVPSSGGSLPAGISVSGNSVRSTGRGPALGFSYTGAPTFTESGEVRFADFPVVTGVIDGSAPTRAGIKVGDVILAVNGQDGRKAGLFRDRRPGTRYTVRVRRGSEQQEVSWTVEAPAAPPSTTP